MNSAAKAIYEALLTDIAEKNLAVNDRIPTEVELAKRFGTNRMNAHYAVKQLEADGIVERKKRRGTYIKTNLSEKALANLRSLAADTVHVLFGRTNPESFLHWDEMTFAKLEHLLNEGGYKVLFHQTPHDRRKLVQYLREIASDGIRCIVFFPGFDDVSFLTNNIDLMSEQRDRLFLFNRGTHPINGLPCHTLSLDPFGEGVMIARHIRAKAYDRIVFLLANEGEKAYWVKKRLEGLCCATQSLSQGKIEVETVHVRPGQMGKKPLAFLKRGNERVVFVAQNDALAASFIDSAQAHGYGVGEDYGVAGFDNNPRFRGYNLTTVAPPVERVGEVLARMIVEQQWPLRAEGLYLTAKIDSRIIERSSCP